MRKIRSQGNRWLLNRVFHLRFCITRGTVTSCRRFPFAALSPIKPGFGPAGLCAVTVLQLPVAARHHPIALPALRERSSSRLRFHIDVSVGASKLWPLSKASWCIWEDSAYTLFSNKVAAAVSQGNPKEPQELTGCCVC